jgi:CubicO group peptidase (beta-lactamase class C family)
MQQARWKILIYFMLATGISRAEFRLWEGENGSRTEAEYVNQAGSKVLLKKKDGKTISVSIQKLSDQDQQYLKDLRQKKSTTPLENVKESSLSVMIGQELNQIVAKEKIPGLVAAIVSSEGILAIGAAGVRKDGTNKSIEMTDLLHLGSCTKAMTSVIMATLVADGSLTWDTTLIEVIPSIEKEIHPEYHSITVWQLLTHRSRLPANAETWRAHQHMKLSKRRLALLEANLEEAPKVEAGEYLYSNLGYMAAGCMAEALTGETWETLMKERLFDPLGMDSAGFGSPGKTGRMDQPWGHIRKAGNWTALQGDNAEAMGPAGTVHCSIEDWGKFVALQFSETNALGLNKTLLNKLITPTTGTYAAGWGISERSWGKGKVLNHSGSNTMWLSVVWAAPNIDRAFLVVTNSKDNNSDKICDQIIGKLIAIDKENK